MAAARTLEVSPGLLGPTGRPLPAFPEPEPLLVHGPARVAAVCNQKGGVGKTTTTINLGAALAEQGRRVLLVDFDPQGALSVGLGIQPHELDATVYNLLMEPGLTAHDVLFKTHVDGLDLLPSNIDLSGAEVQLVHEVAREFVLGRALQQIIPDYDVVLIDCQPSLGLLTVNALACADGVIVPLECEYFALRGVALLMETIDKVSSRLSPKLQMDGLLATMYDSRTLHTREVLAGVVKGFGDKVFHTVINRTVRFPDATVAGEPITSFDPTSNGASSYRELAKEVLERWRQSDPAGPVPAGKPARRRRAAAARRAGPGGRGPAPGQRPGRPLAEDHRVPVRGRAARAGAGPAGPARLRHAGGPRPDRPRGAGRAPGRPGGTGRQEPGGPPAAAGKLTR